MGFDLSMLDPTSRNSPLGGLTRAGIGMLPGGSTVMGLVDSYNANRPATDRSQPTDRSGAGASLTVGVRSAPVAVPWYKKPLAVAGFAVAGVLTLVGVVMLATRRRK